MRMNSNAALGAKPGRTGRRRYAGTARRTCQTTEQQSIVSSNATKPPTSLLCPHMRSAAALAATNHQSKRAPLFYRWRGIRVNL
jgi:hypothetical protein